MAQKILVVDDERELRTLVKSYLEQEGFQVITAVDGREALIMCRYEKPDLILLDLMMPEMGGYDFLRHYNKEGDAPIIVLTARLEENDKVLGLELGADDYVTKPFSMRELTARVRAVLRRLSRQPEANDILRVADVMLDRNGRIVTVNDQRIDLTPSEFAILSILMAAPGHTFSRMELLDKLQGTAFDGASRTIDVHIRRLRTKIEPDPSQPYYIETVFGFGYRFCSES
ncbi:MAG: response regulator transcription factor [Anaerolineales bacterium]|nr:response regulator transcription factor [Anaerolineales bacterium]